MKQRIQFAVERNRVLVPVDARCPFGCCYCYIRGGEVCLSLANMEEILIRFRHFAREADFDTIQYHTDPAHTHSMERAFLIESELCLMSEIVSEVAHFRKQQAFCEEAGRRGLSGFAITASHESITARMERGAERILCLIDAGKNEEALALLNTDQWYAEDVEASQT